MPAVSTRKHSQWVRSVAAKRVYKSATCEQLVVSLTLAPRRREHFLVEGCQLNGIATEPSEKRSSSIRHSDGGYRRCEGGLRRELALLVP